MEHSFSQPQSWIGRWLSAPLHTAAALAVVIAAAGSVAALSLWQVNEYGLAIGAHPYTAQRPRAMQAQGAVLGVTAPQTVVWTNLTNMLAEGGDLEQTGFGCLGCPVAGATSTQQITSGDAYYEIKVPEVSYYIYTGLNTVAASGTTSAVMPFTFEISGPYVGVREAGIYKADAPIVPGDVLRLSIESGKVKYYKNGTAFYTSTQLPAYPLVADVSMQKVGSKLWDGKIATTASVVTPTPTPTPQPTPTLQQPTPTPTPVPPAENQKPVGYLDSVSTRTRTVHGWATDPDHKTSSVKVHLYFDGRAGTAGLTPFEVVASQNRSDVGEHGFTFDIPSRYQDGKWHRVYAYAIDMDDATGKSNVVLSGSPKRFLIRSSTTPTPTPTPTPQPTPTPTPTPVPTPTPTIQPTPTPTPQPTPTPTPTPVPPPTATNVQLPTTYINSAVSNTPSNGTVRNVAAGGDLQAALNAAVPGDKIVLAAGATYTGNYVLPNKTSGSGWITITSSGFNVPEGTRVSPANASGMAKILTPNAAPALETAASAHHYRLIGVEISLTPTAVGDAPNGAGIYGLFKIGAATETSLSQFANNIIIDRSYIHGIDNKNTVRCVAFNGITLTAVDSYISKCHAKGFDSQAIAAYSTPGPLKIVNNYLEGAGENFMIGGAHGAMNIITKDVEFRNNYLFKQPSWKTSGQWSVKNLFELKQGDRILVDGNVMENNWLDAQAGFAVLFQGLPSDSVPNDSVVRAVVSNVTFTRNIVRNSGSGLNMCARCLYGSYDAAVSRVTNVLIKDNLFENINGAVYGSNGILFQVIDGANNITFDHNTGLQSGSTLVLDGANPNQQFVFTNNIAPHNSYGIVGSGYGSGNGAINFYLPGGVITKNVLAGGASASYPAGNFFPASLSAVGFTNYNNGIGGNYALSASSAYKNAGTDGKDLGPDMGSLNSATACVVTGNCGTPTPPAPTPTPTPVPTTIVDGYGDTLSATKFDGWFFSQVGDTSATVVYENTANPAATVSQTATRSVTRTDAATWLQQTYGTGFAITQPLGFSVNPSSVVTTPGTYRVKSLKLNTSSTAIVLGPAAEGTFTIAGATPTPTPTPPPVTTSAVELPRVYVNSAYPSLPGNRTIRSVKSSCGSTANCYTDFQAALNAAQGGDEIVIDAGLTLVAPSGGFNLPNKNSTQWIVIRTANIGSIPGAGTRVSPSHASQMPKILTNDNLAAIQTASGASYYRFVGVEISGTSNVSFNSGLVMLGSVYETNVANQAHHIIFDRVYVHGVPNKNTRRGFFLNSGETAIIDSYVSDFRDDGADAQAILGANGPGPLKVVNNYLEASGENFLIGGIDNAAQGVIMSDVELRGNLLSKPLSWRGSQWVVKNILELKNGQRILIDGNIFENNWAAAQSGMALNIKTVNQDNTMPWSVTQNVTVTNNIIRHVAFGVVVVSRDNNGPSGTTNNVYVANNVFDDVSASRWGNGYGGIFAQVLGNAGNVTFSHNTALHDGDTLSVDGAPVPNFKFTDNISFLNAYGIKGSGAASGNGTISLWFPGSTFAKNVMVGDGASYPANNFYPANASAVGFTNYNNGNGGNYALTSSSPYKYAGTDGKDVGADINIINSATSCAFSGNCGGGTPPSPTPNISSFTASPASITTGQSSTLSWNVTGATSLSINQNVGTVTGTTSKVVNPTATTTYTLTATNSSGSVTGTATVTVNAVTPTTIVDGYGDTLSLTKFDGWFFSQVGDSSATITYENTSNASSTFTQTATRTLTRTDAEQWLRTTYGNNFTVTQPLGFSVNPSSVVTTPGTYRIKSVKLNQSQTSILLGTGAQGTFTIAGTTPPAGNATITVNASQRYQTMNGWEATAQAGALKESSTRTNQSNFDPNFNVYKNSLYDQASSDGLNRLRIELNSGSENPTDYFTQYLNGQLTFNEWKNKWYEVINDNASSASINTNGFKFAQLDFQIDNYVLPLKQRLEARGEQLFLNMCYVDFGTSSFEHYHDTTGGEYGELMLAAFQHMQAKYGFVPNTIEIGLEPDNTPWTGTYLGQAMKGAQSKLYAAGFSPKFILPSTTSINNTPTYYDAAKAVVGDAFITQYVEEIAYHLYGGYSSATAASILSRANQRGVKTSQLEFIGANVDHLIKDLAEANVSGWQQYALAFPGGFDDGSIYYSVNGTNITIGAITKQLRQYFKYVRRGAVRIGATTANSAFSPVAFENANGKHVVVVKTTGSSSFTIGGLAAGTYGVMYTVNGTTTNATDINLASGQNLPTSIPGAGIITLYQK